MRAKLRGRRRCAALRRAYGRLYTRAVAGEQRWLACAGTGASAIRGFGLGEEQSGRTALVLRLLFSDRGEISSVMVPNPDDLLRLEVEEVGWVLLAHLDSLGPGGGGGSMGHSYINQYNFFRWIEHSPAYPSRMEPVVKALMEAWGWLQKEGLLVRRAATGGTDEFFLSRRASQLKSRADFDAYRKASLLPRGQLHSQIGARVYPAFLRAEYDTAVFQAFREVEIAVCKAGGFAAAEGGR